MRAGAFLAGGQILHLPCRTAQRIELGANLAPLLLLQHAVQTRAVLALEAFDRSQAILDFHEAFGRSLRVRRTRAQRKRQVLQLRLDGCPRLEMGRERRVDGRELLDLPPDAAKRRQRRVVPLVQRSICRRAQRCQPLRVRQPAPRRRQRLVLAGIRSDGVDLPLLELQQLDALRMLLALRPRAIQLRGCSLPGRKRGRHFPGWCLQPAVGVEQRQVVMWIEQCLVLMLAVEVEHLPADGLQPADGRQRVVDEGPAAALRRDFPAEHDLFARACLQRRLHHRLRRSGAHQVGRGPRAGNQAQRPEHNRLAGAGLARQHRESGLELQIQPLDDSKILDAEEPNHFRQLGAAPQTPGGWPRGRLP